jgi:hypothetical protein
MSLEASLPIRIAAIAALLVLRERLINPANILTRTLQLAQLILGHFQRLCLLLPKDLHFDRAPFADDIQHRHKVRNHDHTFLAVDLPCQCRLPWESITAAEVVADDCTTLELALEEELVGSVFCDGLLWVFSFGIYQVDLGALVVEDGVEA